MCSPCASVPCARIENTSPLSAAFRARACPTTVPCSAREHLAGRAASLYALSVSFVVIVFLVPIGAPDRRTNENGQIRERGLAPQRQRKTWSVERLPLSSSLDDVSLASSPIDSTIIRKTNTRKYNFFFSPSSVVCLFVSSPSSLKRDPFE